jgi:hypothetical protein
MTARTTERMTARTWLIVGWPAFLVAGVLEMVVFAMVDPGDLHTFGGGRIGLSPQAVYTLAFFVFWGATAVAGALTLMLSRPADDINRAG